MHVLEIHDDSLLKFILLHVDSSVDMMSRKFNRELSENLCYLLIISTYLHSVHTKLKYLLDKNELSLRVIYIHPFSPPSGV